jgi:tRNA(Phe) wybutosine-synthesizing methylase Tyw3
MNKPQELWQKKKSDLLAVINETMEQGNVDKDVLEIMKELIDNAIVKSSMEDYFDDLEQEE